MKMYKSVICLLVLIVGNHARVVTRDEIIDISSNSLADDFKNVTEYFVDLPTIRPDIRIAVENQTNTTFTLVSNTELNCTKELFDLNNTIDDEEVPIPCVKEEPLEPPLILTEYIKENRSQEARNASIVSPDLFLGVQSYSGYFTVNETYGSNVFFWYFPVENKNVSEAPWIVWLQGGPGATSMTGLFDEIGPFTYNIGDGLVRNPYSWLQNHSLLFIDNPVGTGFSFTNSEDGYVQDMDTYGEHLYSVMHQFLIVFPELRGAPLYVAGESYGGKYAPALAIQLHRHKLAGDEDVNLQGLITGNAYVDPPMISQIDRPFYYFGLLDTEQIEIVQPLLDAFRRDVAANNSAAAKLKWNYLILALLLLSNQKHAYNFLRDELPTGRYTYYLLSPQVKRALHVGGHGCEFVNMTVNRRLDGDFLTSAKPLYEELLQHYRLLTYCGQLDQMLPCVLLMENYRTWQWSGAEEFRQATRHPFIHNGRTAGYYKSGGHLTAAVVRGAGHMAPMDAPAQARALVTGFTHHLDLGRNTRLNYSFIREYIKNHTTDHDTAQNTYHYLYL